MEVCVQIMSGDVPHRGIRFSTLGISATCKLDVCDLLACEVTSVFSTTNVWSHNIRISWFLQSLIAAPNDYLPPP